MNERLAKGSLCHCGGGPGSAAPTALATGRSELQCAYPHVLRALGASVYSGISGDYTRESVVFCRLYGALGSTGKVAGLAGKAFTVLMLQQWLRFLFQVAPEQVLAAVFTVYCGEIVYRTAQRCQVFFRIKSILFVLALGCFAIHPSAILFAQDTGPLISDLDWSPNGQQVAAAFGRWESGQEFGRMTPVLLWETLNGIYLLDVAAGQGEFLPLAQPGYSATTLDFRPNGRDIAYTSNHNFGVMGLEPRRIRLQVLSGIIHISMLYNTNGNLILGTRLTAAGAVYSNDILEGPGAGIGQGSLPGLVYPFLYSVWVGEDAAATSAVDGRIYVWQGLDILRVFEGHTAPVRRFVWNAATNLIASGDDTGRVLVWNPDSGEVVHELTGHTAPILDIDWNADGSQIATASLDNTLRAWDWPSGEGRIVRSGELTSAVAYSPDGSQLAYGGAITDPETVNIAIIAVDRLVPPASTPSHTPTPTPTDTPAPT